jgi:Dyp-type peroxidase family
MADALEVADVQGIVVRGYADLPAACYVMAQFDATESPGSWLGDVLGSVSSGAVKPVDAAVNVAFTASGLQKLGLGGADLNAFSAPFQEGMTEAYRARTLGDQGPNAPETWVWGGPNNPQVDVVLLLFARDAVGLTQVYQSQLAILSRHSCTEIVRLDTVDLRGKEHFGFHDGVSQPIIPGLSKKGTPNNTVNIGEFVLGYVNEYGLYTDRPLLEPQDDPRNHLPSDVAGSGKRDLGRNGSYVVFRHLSQDVDGFWNFVGRNAGEMSGSTSDPTAASIALAARMVGRWPSGAPLVLAPDGDRADLADANDFDYFHADLDGLRCPLGSHVRRANPRNSLDPQPGSQESIAVGKRHRILRRGREYGSPRATPANPGKEDPADASADRGLYFICLSANIARQFEFVQHTWINNPKFRGLYADADPLVAPRKDGGNTFTIQATPVRRRVSNLPQFVTVRGGAYFFLPGLRALRYLASR